MSRREIELITALAEGSLEDETEARALLERSSRLRTIYEEQKTAFDALSSLPAAALSESESAALRRDVWTALTTTSIEPVKNPRGRWAWGYAAVFVFALVGLAAVLNGMTAEDGAATFAPPANLGAQGDSASGTTTTPGTEMTESAALMSTWAETARVGSSDFLEADPVMDAQVTSADLSECQDEIDVDLQTYELLTAVEKDGTTYAIARLQGAAGTEAASVMIIDLDQCEITYQD